MATKKDTLINLITQPPSGNSREDIGIEDKENHQIAPELHQCIEKVQIDPPNNTRDRKSSESKRKKIVKW